jgi:hypothetical protein
VKAADASAKRLLSLLTLPAGTKPVPAAPAAASAALSLSPSLPSVPNLIDLERFFTAARTPAAFIGSLAVPTGAQQDDSGGSGGEQWTSFRFRPVPHVVALRELVINAVKLPHGGVAVRVDSQTAPLPTLTGNGRGPGSLRVVESTMAGQFGFQLSCDPAGGTVPDPARICAAIRANPALLYSFPGPDHSCPAGVPGISLAGTWGRKPLHSSFSVCTGGQEQLAGDWASLLPSEKTENAIHIDRGIGLVRIGETDQAVIALLHGTAAAPASCTACTLTFGAGYDNGAGQPAGWTITIAGDRVVQIENNTTGLQVGRAFVVRGFNGLHRSLRRWSARTCGSDRELVHTSSADSTIIVYGVSFKRVIVTTGKPRCS